MSSVDDRHRRMAQRVAARLLADGAATAVVLHGSVARGDHRADSDVDLVAIGPTSTGMGTTEVDGLRAEILTRTEEDWWAALARPLPTWAYAWSDGVVLVRSDEAADRLATEAARILRCFRPRPGLLMEYIDLWEHVLPKLTGTVARGDETEIGYAVGLSTQQLVESLFLVNDVVPPPVSASETFERLRRLPAPDRLDDRLRLVMTHPDARVRAREKLRLVDDVVAAMRAKIAALRAGRPLTPGGAPAGRRSG